MRPLSTDAYKLMHEGILALSQVEENGMRVDTEYLAQKMKDTKEAIQQMEHDIKQDEVFKVWKKRFKNKTKLDSGDQLGKVLFETMGYTPKEFTSGGEKGTPKPKTDIAALEQLNIPFVKKYLAIKKLKKARNTYLKGIQRETVDGIIHPVFNLHIARTWRSSSDNPNFQNFPIRDPNMGELIRRCFIPRDGNHIIEIDYSGIEVHSAQWYHHDPVMLSYLCDKTKDMHRDVSQQCYKLPDSEMSPQDKEDAKRIKKIRFWGKNGFVFPQFYGDWYMSCASYMWNAITREKLVTRDGTSLKKWLRKKGITRLGQVNSKIPPMPGTFIAHIKEVEFDFWNRRFKVYKQWKDSWWEEYQRTGQVQTLTGFVFDGLYDRKKIINYPIQGTAFHCLLWSLIRLQKLLMKKRMKSLIIGQIHDSIVADVPAKEKDDYLELANRVMTVDIKKHWNWITTPIEVEAEVTPLNRSWFEKEEVKISV